MANVKDETIQYGSAWVPVVRRAWPVAEKIPYRKTYELKPGQMWAEAGSTDKQWECYVVEPDGNYLPVGVKIARELIAEGAVQAVMVEMWGGLVLLDDELVCVETSGLIGQVLDEVHKENHGSLAGFPDVIGVFRDGRVALREAKCTNSKDRLGPKQHEMADLLRKLYGSRLDLQVVEWGLP